jgi:hypothetical protein
MSDDLPTRVVPSPDSLARQAESLWRCGQRPTPTACWPTPA